MPGRRKPVKNEEFDENKQVFIFVNSKFAISILHSFTLHFFLQGDYIWIEPVSKREFDVAIGARVVSAEGRKIQVHTCQKSSGFPPQTSYVTLHACLLHLIRKFRYAIITQKNAETLVTLLFTH